MRSWEESPFLDPTAQCIYGLSCVCCSCLLTRTTFTNLMISWQSIRQRNFFLQFQEYIAWCIAVDTAKHAPALKSFQYEKLLEKMNSFYYDSWMLLDFIQLLKYFCIFSRMGFQFQASHHPPVSDIFLLILLCEFGGCVGFGSSVLCSAISLPFIRKL